jgi:hypothetical protein
MSIKISDFSKVYSTNRVLSSERLEAFIYFFEADYIDEDKGTVLNPSKLIQDLNSIVVLDPAHYEYNDMQISILTQEEMLEELRGKCTLDWQTDADIKKNYPDLSEYLKATGPLDFYSFVFESPQSRYNIYIL